jgi:uncharacterized protein
MLREARVKFTRELSARLVVRSVSADTILINDDKYTESIALTAERLLGIWPTTPVKDLSAADFERVFDVDPDVVLLGTGDSNVFPPRELMFAFARKGVGLEVMDTAAAARTFNVLANEGRRVAAVLYLHS